MGRTARVVIENVKPEIDGGRFAVKRVTGEPVDVSATIFVDGHDRLAAILRYRLAEPSAPPPTARSGAGANKAVREGGAGREGPREPSATRGVGVPAARDDALGGVQGSPPLKHDKANDWCEIEMRELGNDRWAGRFYVDTIGRYEYTLLAWVDRFASWRDELSKKVAAGQPVGSELLEGAALIHIQVTTSRLTNPQPATLAAAAADPETHPGAWLLARAAVLASPGDEAARIDAALDPMLVEVMRRHDPRSSACAYDRTLSVNVDRPRARFGAWYEMFPRSAGPDPTRSATFTEAARRLPDLAALGFDVLYLPPIHPISRSGRKGRNNALTAGPEDPGSPWAIGAAEGGHMAVEPGLGTLEDFQRFIETARRVGLEIALDLAFQCAPDHPYVQEHPEWFRHRPDGTTKYAENPPKKYQDIYPFDFETEAWPALWAELKRIATFWIEHGVRIFRVDNPHTKPFRFWEWLLADLRRAYPDTIFLSEAFTRPAAMKYLAKIGFSQSYTYFTWRNTKAELVEYFTELTQGEVREYLRPNLFANTPDILHAYLQGGGRPAFQVRLVLAATLGASYGIYSGFELCENRAMPGTEEYLDSEKYQYRQWDWDRPGHIKELVARVNGIRREHPALHSDWHLRFHPTDSDHLICYSKVVPDLTDIILVVVNLDPHHMQHGWVQVPVWEWGLNPAYDVHDLLDGERFTWRGDWNYVRLDPAVRPAHIFHIPKSIA